MKSVLIRVVVAAALAFCGSSGVHAAQLGPAAQSTSSNSKSAAGQCTDVLVIGARGSGERLGEWSDVGPTVNQFVTKFRSKLKSHGQTMKLMAAVDYPARSVGSIVWGDIATGDGLARYMQGVGQGVDEAVAKIKAQAKRCFAQRFVLVGYSQGAMVAHRTYLKLPADLRPRVAAVVMIADPDRAKDTHSILVGGPAAPSSSVGIRSYTSPDISDIASGPYPRPLSWEICTKGDVVCDTRAGTLRRPFRGVGLHTGYAAELQQVRMVEKVARQAAKAIGGCSAACSAGKTLASAIKAKQENDTALVARLAPSVPEATWDFLLGPRPATVFGASDCRSTGGFFDCLITFDGEEWIWWAHIYPSTSSGTGWEVRAMYWDPLCC